MSKREISSWVCTAFGTLAVAITSSANVLVNPGFEANASVGSPPNTNLTGWSISVSGYDFTSSSPDLTDSGIGSLQLSSSGGTHVPVAYQIAAASPGQTWDFQGFAEITNPLPANSTFALLKLVWLDASNNLLQPEPGPGAVTGPYAGIESTYITSNTAVNAWQLLNTSGVAPPNTAQAEFIVILVDQSAAKIWFDDMSASVVPEPDTMALALLGLLGLGMIVRRRRGTS